MLLKKDNCGFDFKQFLIGLEGMFGVVIVVMLWLLLGIVDCVVVWVGFFLLIVVCVLLLYCEDVFGEVFEGFEVLLQLCFDVVLYLLFDVCVLLVQDYVWYVLIEVVVDCVIVDILCECIEVVVVVVFE